MPQSLKRSPSNSFERTCFSRNIPCKQANLTLVPRVSVIIPNYNRLSRLRKCLSSVLDSSLRDIEVIVVDNGSHDGSQFLVRQIAAEDARVRLIPLSRNEGVTRALNAGIQVAKSVYVAFLNNDTEVAADWLEEPLRILERPTVAGVQSKLIDIVSGRIDSAGCCLDMHGCVAERGRYLYKSKADDSGQYDSEDEIFSAGCPASVFKRLVILETGLFDPDFFSGYEDADLCWRIRLLGYSILFAPMSVVYHHRNVTSMVPAFRRVTRFHFAKNRTAMLVKNLELGSLFRSLPMIVFMYLVSMIGYSRDSPLEGIESIRGLAWNITHARKIFRSRILVQTKRRIPDKELRRAMASTCVFVSHYMKPSLLGYQ